MDAWRWAAGEEAGLIRRRFKPSDLGLLRVLLLGERSADAASGKRGKVLLPLLSPPLLLPTTPKTPPPPPALLDGDAAAAAGDDGAGETIAAAEAEAATDGDAKPLGLIGGRTSTS